MLECRASINERPARLFGLLGRCHDVHSRIEDGDTLGEGVHLRLPRANRCLRSRIETGLATGRSCARGRCRPGSIGASRTEGEHNDEQGTETAMMIHEEGLEAMTGPERRSGPVYRH
jgi:hypothetical protein